jgi:hypothetical protein
VLCLRACLPSSDSTGKGVSSRSIHAQLAAQPYVRHMALSYGHMAPVCGAQPRIAKATAGQHWVVIWVPADSSQPRHQATASAQ